MERRGTWLESEGRASGPGRRGNLDLTLNNHREINKDPNLTSPRFCPFSVSKCVKAIVQHN